VWCELSQYLRRQDSKGLVGQALMASRCLTDLMSNAVLLSVYILVPLSAGSTEKKFATHRCRSRWDWKWKSERELNQGLTHVQGQASLVREKEEPG
jgi:hypothetical protein